MWMSIAENTMMKFAESAIPTSPVTIADKSGEISSLTATALASTNIPFASMIDHEVNTSPCRPGMDGLHTVN